MTQQTAPEGGQVKYLDQELRCGTIKPDGGGTDVFFTDSVIQAPGQWSRLYRGRPVRFQRRPQTRVATTVILTE